MVMNFVYPISALYAGPLALLFYFRVGSNTAIKKLKGTPTQMIMKKKLFWQSVAIGALHCGSGCTLGDMIAESVLVFLPVTLFASRLAGTWTIDYIFAFIIGIIFEYYAIKPMKKLSSTQIFIAALKADTLSLTFWQIGMYGWMAIVFFCNIRP